MSGDPLEVRQACPHPNEVPVLVPENLDPHCIEVLRKQARALPDVPDQAVLGLLPLAYLRPFKPSYEAPELADEANHYVNLTGWVESMEVTGSAHWSYERGVIHVPRNWDATAHETLVKWVHEARHGKTGQHDRCGNDYCDTNWDGPYGWSWQIAEAATLQFDDTQYVDAAMDELRFIQDWD